MFVTSKKPSLKHAMRSTGLLRGKEEDFYGAGPSPGCGIMRLIIQRVFRGVRTGKRAPANEEVSQAGIADQRRTLITQGDIILLGKNLVLQQPRHT